MDNTLGGHDQTPADEPLPPYSPYEPSAESEAYTDAAPAWEPPQPPEWLGMPHEPDVEASGPTAMVVSSSDTSILATQLLHPTKGIFLKLQGLKSAKVVVRVDNEHRYNGLVRISARFRHNPVSSGSNESPVRASSQAFEKADRVEIEFTATPELVDSCEAVARLDLVLPRDAMLPSLVLRLPANSFLELSDIASNVVERIDAAIVSGAVGLSHVYAGSLRMAIGDGHMKASSVTVSRGSAEFVAMRGYIHVFGCTANGNNVRVNSPDATVKMKNIVASKVHIQAARAATTIRSAVADKMTVSSISGHLALVEIAARVLEVSAETSPVAGSWDISERIHIAVTSAIVQGQLSITGESARAYIATSEWPVRLAIRKDYVGYFDIKTTNSVVSLGLVGAILSKDQPHHQQGAIGNGTSALYIDNANSPVVVGMY
ncbi:hypothetical protein GGI20_005919 [Coemansia sp. BCRC 34301]|nr:hypothetical protein GGI20_005919 [Coemansia sp. BCRC 34301]